MLLYRETTETVTHLTDSASPFPELDLLTTKAPSGSLLSTSRERLLGTSGWNQGAELSSGSSKME